VGDRGNAGAVDERVYHGEGYVQLGVVKEL
jgi:hypothetical protein